MSAHLLVKDERRDARIDGAATFRTARDNARTIKERREAAQINEHMGTVPSCSPVLTADFNLWAPTYTGPKFNVIHCDFPYGINAQASGVHPSYYDDSPETFLTLCKTLAVYLDNFCAADAHMIFWFGTSQYSQTWENLKLLDGFQFDEVPLIWHKPTGIAPDPGRRPRRVYETAFFGWRGNARITHVQDNLYAATSANIAHAHEKPQEMLEYFFSMFVDGGSRLLDPTCGSGSALRAAKAAGAGTVLGLEQDEGFAEGAIYSLKGGK